MRLHKIDYFPWYLRPHTLLNYSLTIGPKSPNQFLDWNLYEQQSEKQNLTGICGIVIINMLFTFWCYLKLLICFMKNTRLSATAECKGMYWIWHYYFVIWYSCLRTEKTFAISIYCQDVIHFRLSLSQIFILCFVYFEVGLNRYVIF